MALSTNRTLLTQTGINTHQVLNVGGLDSAGIATFLNFKTGTTNVHNIGVEAAGINVLGGDTPIGAGATIYNDGGARFSGIVSATSFVGDITGDITGGGTFTGDISNATGAAAGLGTALSQTQTDPLNKVYYTDKVLSISTTTTIDHPATANLAYTQYGDIKIENGHDLIIKTDDDFKYDILGISTTKIPNNQFPSGLSGDLIGNVTGNVTGNITGNVTTDKIIPTGGVPSGGGGGIIQVVQVAKTDTFSTTSQSFVDITGLSATITPKFNTSKILFQYTVSFATRSAYMHFRLVRGSTPIFIADADGNRARLTFGTWHTNDAHHEYLTNNFSGSFLDSPATTSATTYKIQTLITTNGRTGYINRSVGDDNQSYEPRTVSNIVLMEVSA